MTFGGTKKIKQEPIAQERSAGLKRRSTGSCIGVWMQKYSPCTQERTKVDTLHQLLFPFCNDATKNWNFYKCYWNGSSMHYAAIVAIREWKKYKK